MIPRDQLHQLVEEIPDETVPITARLLQLVIRFPLTDDELAQWLLERERHIAGAYAAGYGANPQEEWIGQASLGLAGRAVKDERPA